MTYRIQINGSWVQPTDPSWWGCDVFDGRRIIPPGRDLIADNTWGPGVNSIPGPPESSTFKLSFWVAGDGDADKLESRLDDLLRFFKDSRLRQNFDFIWEPHVAGRFRHAPARIRSLDVKYEQRSFDARVDVVFENLAGYWRDSIATTKEQGFGTSTVANDGDAPIYDAVLEVTGPAVNPMFSSQGRWVKWMGSIAKGQLLRIGCSPITCTLDGVNVIQNLTWYGSEGRALDIVPGGSVGASAEAGTNYAEGTRWRVRYRNVRY